LNLGQEKFGAATKNVLLDLAGQQYEEENRRQAQSEREEELAQRTKSSHSVIRHQDRSYVPTVCLIVSG
jgi:hypothetical protein